MAKKQNTESVPQGNNQPATFHVEPDDRKPSCLGVVLWIVVCSLIYLGCLGAIFHAGKLNGHRDGQAAAFAEPGNQFWTTGNVKIESNGTYYRATLPDKGTLTCPDSTNYTDMLRNWVTSRVENHNEYLKQRLTATAPFREVQLPSATPPAPASSVVISDWTVYSNDVWISGNKPITVHD